MMITNERLTFVSRGASRCVRMHGGTNGGGRWLMLGRCGIFGKSRIEVDSLRILALCCTCSCFGCFGSCKAHVVGGGGGGGERGNGIL